MFTTPCYIRKNTPELREKLDALGYYSRVTQPKIDGSNSGVLFCSNGRYSETPFGHPEEINRTIDCGENEDLFLALAALRDDTDIHQWFIYDTMDCTDEKRRMREFLQCTDDSIEDMMFYDCAFLDCHKATVEELIEKFKVEKEEDK